MEISSRQVNPGSSGFCRDGWAHLRPGAGPIRPVRSPHWQNLRHDALQKPENGARPRSVEIGSMRRSHRVSLSEIAGEVRTGAQPRLSNFAFIPCPYFKILSSPNHLTEISAAVPSAISSSMAFCNSSNSFSLPFLTPTPYSSGANVSFRTLYWSFSFVI